MTKPVKPTRKRKQATPRQAWNALKQWERDTITAHLHDRASLAPFGLADKWTVAARLLSSLSRGRS